MAVSVARHLTARFANPPGGLLVSTRPETIPTPGKATDDGTDTGVILLVEDNGDVRNFVRTVLQAGGFTVLEAADGAEALQLASQFPGHLHLLLTDVNMPRMSGPVLARKLGPSRPTLRVLFMSGYSGPFTDPEDRLPAGAELLPKPFTPASLLHAVRAILR